MADQNYSQRELDEKFKNIDTLIREKHDDAMIKSNEILVQTTKTNGRVSALEKDVNSFGNWKWFITGGLTIISILVVPILIYFLNHLLQ